MIKHKYAELIHAWADGATIQVYWTGSGKTQFEWMDVERPDWYIDDCTTKVDMQEFMWLKLKSVEI